MEYKVVKEFGSAKKGDILTYNEDTELLTMDIQDAESNRFMAMDEDTAEKFAEDGYLVLLEEPNCDECEEEEYCEYYEKIGKIIELVSDLKEQYDADHKMIEEKYNNQEIPACVKVEADTVYFNMNKILDKIADIINE